MYSNNQLKMNDKDVDIVICALHSDLIAFMEEWRPIFSQFHLIIVKDPELKDELQIPNGFNLDVYTKSEIISTVGPSSAHLFVGYSSRYFGYLVSQKKYIVSIDTNCLPAKNPDGSIIDAVAHHLRNLKTPATPLFFNTLYDPFRDGSDFVRGYPFSLRTGVPCAISCGLWLNVADLDAPTQALNPDLRNERFVDAVITVPTGTHFPFSGVNFGFDRGLVGGCLCPGLRLEGEGKVRWETLEDVWCGMCAKVVCDHLGVGVKTGVPYVWRREGGDAVDSLKKKWEGVKLMEAVVPFFDGVRLGEDKASVEDCVVELAKLVRDGLGSVDGVFVRAADSMLEWVNLWKKVAKVASSSS